MPFFAQMEFQLPIPVDVAQRHTIGISLRPIDAEHTGGSPQQNLLGTLLLPQLLLFSSHIRKHPYHLNKNKGVLPLLLLRPNGAGARRKPGGFLIQLILHKKHHRKLLPAVMWSECRDSNSGPLEPHSSAIPNFATPRILFRSPERSSIILQESGIVKHNF